MKLIFAVLYVMNDGLTRCYKTEGFYRAACNAGLAMRIRSVCLSVRLSVSQMRDL